MISGLSRCIALSSFVVFSTVALNAQTISSGTPPNPVVNTAYTFTFTASGGGCTLAPTYSWSATGVPPGLTLDSASGVLSGTPTTAGPYTLNVTVDVNGCTGQTATQGYAITVLRGITFTTQAAPAATINTPYTLLPAAQDDVCTFGNLVFSSSDLPSWLSYNAELNFFAGTTPATAGVFTFHITATQFGDCSDFRSTATQAFTINVGGQEGFYVLDIGNSAISVLKLNTTGGTGLTLNATGGVSCPDGMAQPCGSYAPNFTSTFFQDFAVDAQGNFYVPAGSAVLEFAPGASTPTTRALVSNLPAMNSLSGSFASVALDSANNLVVADNGNHAIWLFPAGGGTPVLVGNYPSSVSFEDVFVRIAPGQYIVAQDGAASVSLAGMQTLTQFYQFTACTPSPAQCPPAQSPSGLLASPILDFLGGFTVGPTGDYVTIQSGEGPIQIDSTTSSGTVRTLYDNSSSNLLTTPVGISYDPTTGNYLLIDSEYPRLLFLSAGPLGNAGLAIIQDGSPLNQSTAALAFGIALPGPPPVIPPLLITGGPLSGGFAFEPYASGVSATGGIPPYTFTGSGFPAGIDINQYTGAIAGTTKITGTFPLSITVTDSRGVTASASLSLVISTPPPVQVTGGMLTSAVVQIPLSRVLTATGGAPSYTWALIAGTLPPGLSLNIYGTLSGIPLAVGTYSFTVRATDTAGGSAIGAFQITIQPPPLTPTTSAPLPTGMVSVAYPYFSFSLNGGTLPYIFTLNGGNLPPGLNLSPAGLITGTPTAPGNYSFTVNQTDVINDPSTTYSITIQPYSPDIVLSAGSAAFTLNTPTSTLPYEQTVQVQSSDVTKTLSYSVAITPATATWVSVSPNGGNTPGSFAIGLTSDALALANSNTPYTATVVVTCITAPCQGNQHTVAVSLTVNNAPPQLSVLTPVLSFNSITSAPQSSTELFAISNTGGGGIGFASITCGAPWCTVGHVPGSIGAGVTATIPITANPAGLGQGYYYTNLSIVSSAGKATVPVTYYIAANGTIGLYPAGTVFNVPQGGYAVGNTSFLVNISGSQQVPFTASVSPSVPWLTVRQSSQTASGTQPATVNLVFDQAQVSALKAGAYYATVVIKSSNAANSPQSFEVVLNVTPAAQGTTPDPVPGGLIFLSQGAAPPPQTVNIYTGSLTPVNYQSAVATKSGGTWLSVSPTFGSTSAISVGTGTISVNPSGLKPGVYTGTVSYQFTPTAVRSVNVTLVVENVPSTSQTTSALHPQDTPACIPTQIVPTSTALVSNFAAPAAWPIALNLNLSDDCGSPINNAQVVSTFSNGDPPLILQLSDTTGDYVTTWTPHRATNQIAVNAVAAAQGFPNAALQLAGAVTANNAPLLDNSSIGNFYNPVGGAPLAPGTLVQITGQYLAAQTLSNMQIPVPTSLGGTTVIIGGVEAPVTSVSPNQINAQVPFELPAGQPYQVIVNANNALTMPQSFQAGAASPGLSVLPTGLVQAGHQNGGAITEASPAKPGEYISVYLVGMGGTTIPVASGEPGPGAPFANTTIAPTITVNNENTSFVFSGLIPGLVGVYQVNLQVPMDAANGDLLLAVSQDGFVSNSGILPVHN